LSDARRPVFASKHERASGRALRAPLFAGLAVAVAVGVALYVTRRAEPPQPVEPPPLEGPVMPDPRSSAPPSVRFTDVTRDAGIEFVHENGAVGDKLLPETMGGGCAFFDYDGDGDPDLLLVNSDRWPDQRGGAQSAPTMRLFRNEGSGRFADVTAGSGLDVTFYGMGVAIADVDADGWRDVFVTALGRNRLLRNEGGSFRDITEAAGVAGAEDDWSTGSAFLDFDNDGDLDLFVVNYVRWSRELDFEVDFRLTGIGRAYGPPTAFEGTQPYLYRNEGDGTFTDVSRQAGVQTTHPTTGRPVAKGLAVLPIDVDRDGWMDLLVANDTVQNQLFHNRGDGGFTERGTETGVAFDRNGAATGAMGIDAADVRDDGNLAIAIGNFANEMTSFFVAQQTPLQFADEAIVAGIGSPSRLALTFGLFFFDYDLDGRVDLLQANGHLEDEIHRVQTSQHYEQPPQLFWNAGPDAPRTLVEVAPQTLGDFASPMVGRGAAYADTDGDGDLDVLLTQVGRSPRLLRNDQALGRHWLRVRLRGRGANRDGIGAWIELVAAGRRQVRQVMPTRSYLSQVELPVTFGLGDARSVESLTVTWPDGGRQVVETVAVDDEVVVIQGEVPGEPSDPDEEAP